MASSYSTDLKLELMATGENAGTWGDNTNNNLNLIQQAIAGYEAVALSDGGTVALAMTDKTISNARNMIIKFTGTLTTASTVTIPDSIEKFYIFDLSAVTGVTNLTIKTVSGSGFTAGEAKIVAAYSDGTDLNEIALDTLGGTIGTAQIADDAVTLAKMASGTAGNIISYDASGDPVAVATGTCGQVLTSAGPGAPPTFADAAGGGAVSWDTTAKTASFTAVAGEGYFVNTTSGAITVTLPATPSAGDIVSVKDYANTFDTNNVTLARNGSPIGGDSANDAILLTKGLSVTLIYVDATKGWLVIDDGLQDSAPTETFITATGGTITTCGDYKIHTFTGPGCFTVSEVSACAPQNIVSYLVVAGGGSGSGAPSNGSGGGGAGGFREYKNSCDPYTASPLNGNPCGTAITVTATGYPITVGAGAAAGNPAGIRGSSSIFSTITSTGGGGGYFCTATPNQPGGSGGGIAYGNPSAGGSGNTPPVSPPQGNPGGTSSGPFPTDYSGSGGGGAGAAGGNRCNGGGDGGAGVGTLINPATGESGPGCLQYYSGGGGGGVATSGPSLPGGTGGIGGGANGQPNNGSAGLAATVNTGGGGGGAGVGSPASGTGGAGGSGIVIIRYKYQ